MNSRLLKILFVFLAVYVVLFALAGFTPLQDWNFTWDFSRLDYTLFLFPIVGFFFIYMLIPWVREEVGFGEYFYYFFPVIFVLGAFLAFYVAVYYYYGNQAFLSNVDISVFQLDYVKLFIESSFIYFVLAGIGGWGARVLIENFEQMNKQ
ncbi:MAG TPA: hypothetical protein VFF13_05290 [archaeon]|nr:hypothetical protein [archaeon]